MEMSLVDFSFAATDSTLRPLDFCLITDLKDSFDVNKLEEGAELAFKSYPKSRCRIEAYEWVKDESEWGICQLNSEEQMNEFICSGLDLKHERAIKQAVAKFDGRRVLITKFHHALGDGISLFLWLEMQLNQGLQQDTPLVLKEFKGDVIRNKFSPAKPSQSFGYEKKLATSAQRNSQVMILDPSGIDFRRYSFTYNDFLSAVIFKSMEEWNEVKRIEAKRLGLYIPVNIRENPFEGFGNGSSRIKIYTEGHTFLEKAQFVRKQVDWCKENGMWKMPTSLSFFSKLPVWFSALILKFYSKLPHIDMGSMLFSHIEKTFRFETLFSHFSSVQLIVPLYEAYSMGINCIGFEGKTVLSLTWDEARFRLHDAELMHQIIARNWDLAKREVV